MLDLPLPLADDHPSPGLVDVVRDTMTVSKIPRAGRAGDGENHRLTLRTLPAGTPVPARTSILAAPSVTLTFTASPPPPTGI